MDDRLVILESAAIALKANNLDDKLKQLARFTAHKLTGSLGSLGFTDGSKLAAEIEVFLDRETLIQVEQTESFNKLIRSLRDKFDAYEPASSMFLDSSPLLLIVDNDSNFIQQLATEAAANNLQTEIATTASQAQELIRRDRPAIVLLKIFQIKTKDKDRCPIDSLDLLAELHQQMPSLPIVVIISETALFNTNEDFINRLKSVRRAEHTLLVQPVTPAQAILSVTELLQRSGAKTKIMAIDDDSLFLQTMKASLKPWGFEITTLDNSQQFWQVLQATSPDLVVLDIEMPDIDGMELCCKLKNDIHWNHLPVLFLTAHQDLETQDRAFAIGADDYVSKPVKGIQLATRILNRLSRVRAIQSKFSENKF